MQLLAGGRILEGEEAHALGLGNAVVAHEELMDEAAGWCDRIQELPRRPVFGFVSVLAQIYDIIILHLVLTSG